MLASPHGYMNAERPSGLGTLASPSPTTLLETVRGLTVSIGSEMPSTKWASPTRVMSVAVALKFWLLPVPSIERYAVMQRFPLAKFKPGPNR